MTEVNMNAEETEYSRKTIENFKNASAALSRDINLSNLMSGPESPAEKLKIAIKQISDATGETHTVLEMHANNTLPVTDETLAMAASLLHQVNNALGELVLYLAAYPLTRG